NLTWYVRARPMWLERPSGLARRTGLAGSGLDGSTRLTRTGWGRAVGSESGCTAGHIGHGGRVRRVLGHRSSLRVALDVFATGEFAGEEGDHGEHAGEEGKQRGEERQVGAHMPVDRRGEQVDEGVGEGHRREHRDELVEAE